jgi:hypothetical protein
VTVRRVPAAFVAVAIALGLSACTSQVGGQATPSSPAAGTTAPATSTATADPFAALSPCTILDQVLAGQGFPPATPTIASSKVTCHVTKATSGDTPGVDVGLSLQPGRGYKENVGNPSQASEGKVNGRPAVEEREPEHSSGQCGVWLEVKPLSRVLVLVSSSRSDTAAACTQVEEIAAKVEPLLPKNN